jgi:tetratricopeptide (TPR) repeat protein
LQPPNPVLTSRVLTRAGYVYKRSGDISAADAAYAEALEIETRRYGEQHPETIMTLANLSGLRTDEHRYSEAEALARRAYTAAHAKLPEPHIQTGNAALALGVALYGEDQAAQAVSPLREAAATFRKLLPADSAVIARTDSALGLALAQSGDRSGEVLLRDAVQRIAQKHSSSEDDARVVKGRLQAFLDGVKYEP